LRVAGAESPACGAFDNNYSDFVPCVSKHLSSQGRCPGSVAATLTPAVLNWLRYSARPCLQVCATILSGLSANLTSPRGQHPRNHPQWNGLACGCASSHQSKIQRAPLKAPITVSAAAQCYLRPVIAHVWPTAARRGVPVRRI
jgi:hypothetical protein